MRAAKTLQKANANGGKGGNGVDLGDSFPDSFAIYGAVTGTRLHVHISHLPSLLMTPAGSLAQQLNQSCFTSRFGYMMLMAVHVFPGSDTGVCCPGRRPGGQRRQRRIHLSEVGDQPNWHLQRRQAIRLLPTLPAQLLLGTLLGRLNA